MSCGLLRLALQRLYAHARVCVHWLTAIVASRRCRIPLSRLWLPKAFNHPTEKAAVACAGSSGLACPDGCEESHEMLLPARQKQSSHSSIHSLEPCRFVAPDTVGSSKNRHAKQNGRGSEEALPSAPHRSLVLAMLQCRRWEASWHCLQERPFDIRSPTGGLIECGGTFGRRSISPLLRHCCQTVATEAIPILPALHCQVTAGAPAFGSLRQPPLRLPHVSEDLSEEQQPPDEDELSESRTMQVDRR
jgi:hypothetical protein